MELVNLNNKMSDWHQLILPLGFNDTSYFVPVLLLLRNPSTR